MLRKLLSHAAIYGLSAQVPRLVGVLTLPIITQFLTSADYGVAGVVTAYTAAFNVVHSLGLSVVMVNAYAKQPQRFKWIWRQLQGFMTMWSVLYGLLMMAVLYHVVPSEAHEHRLIIALLHSLPTMLFTNTELQTNLYHQLKQRPLPIALRSFVAAGIGVALNVYLIAGLKMGYMGWFYAYFISLVIGFAFNFYSLYIREAMWPIFRFKWQRIKNSLQVALPVVPHNVANFLLDTSDRLVLSVLNVPIRNIGLYNVASSFGSYFNIASFAISQAASPFYLKYYAQQTGVKAARETRRLTFSMLVIFLFTTTLLSLWMREIFVLLIRNEELRQAYPLAIVILMGYNYRPMYNATVNYLTYQEHTSKLWPISVVAGVANVVLNFILVPIYGFEVAAFTTFGALMYMGYAGFYLKEFRLSSLVSYYPMAWLLATVGLLVATYYLVELSIAYKTILTAVIGLIAIAFVARERVRLFKK